MFLENVRYHVVPTLRDGNFEANTQQPCHGAAT